MLTNLRTDLPELILPGCDGRAGDSCDSIHDSLPCCDGHCEVEQVNADILIIHQVEYPCSTPHSVPVSEHQVALPGGAGQLWQLA